MTEPVLVQIVLLFISAALGAIWIEIRALRTRLHTIEGAFNVLAGLLRSKGIELFKPLG